MPWRQANFILLISLVTFRTPTYPMRLNKFISNAGICSRRKADEYILNGQVKVNGKVVRKMGQQVSTSDKIRFKDKPVSLEKKVYVLLNKPKDYIATSKDERNRKTVLDLVKGAASERLYSVGRLDRNTTGLLLLTNDGELAQKMTHPSFQVEKLYHVSLDKALLEQDLEQIRKGVELEDGKAIVDQADYPDPKAPEQVGIAIHIGKNRIIRRIFESLGYKVKKLDRVVYAGLTKKNLPRGKWRFLQAKEVSRLLRYV